MFKTRWQHNKSREKLFKKGLFALKRTNNFIITIYYELVIQINSTQLINEFSPAIQHHITRATC